MQPLSEYIISCRHSECIQNLAVTYEAVRNGRRVGDHGRRHGLAEEDVLENLLPFHCPLSHIALGTFGLAYLLLLPSGDLPSLPHLDLPISICVK